MECIDSDALIGILRGNPDAKPLFERLDESSNYATTSVNAYEILLGAKRLKNEDKISEARKLLAKFSVLYFDEKAAELASTIHADLLSRGEQLDLRDIFIGSIALSNGCSVTTRNVKHFSRIKELKVRKW